MKDEVGCDSRPRQQIVRMTKETDFGVRQGVGCFFMAVGLAVAFAIAQWAMIGFPKFWQ